VKGHTMISNHGDCGRQFRRSVPAGKQHRSTAMAVNTRSKSQPKALVHNDRKPTPRPTRRSRRRKSHGSRTYIPNKTGRTPPVRFISPAEHQQNLQRQEITRRRMAIAASVCRKLTECRTRLG